MTPMVLPAGIHIAFVCSRCPSLETARLVLPADQHLTIDGACEHAAQLGWTFQSDGEVEDGAVVCPSCREPQESD